MTLSDVTTVTARYRGLSLTGLVEDYHPGCVSGPPDNWEQPSGGNCIELTGVEVDTFSPQDVLEEWFPDAIAAVDDWTVPVAARHAEAMRCLEANSRASDPAHHALMEVGVFWSLVAARGAVRLVSVKHAEVCAIRSVAYALFVAWVRLARPEELCEAIEEEAERSC